MPSSIAICIATCRRPRGLRRLLEAVIEQERPSDDPRVEIIVVDNDTEDAAAAVCASVSERSSRPVHVLLEPVRSLARVRNAAIDAAADRGAEWIVFIDDDESPRPGWLATLAATQASTGADVVAGPVITRFDDDTPGWIATSGLWQRERHPDGRRLATASTANVMVRLATLRELALRFDERFGRMGGEDEHLFRRLARGGGSIVWADGAVVDEWLGGDRATPGWLLGRKHRVGTATAVILADLHGPIVGRGLGLLRGVIWIGLGGLRTLAGLLVSRATRLRGRVGIAYGTGLVAGVLGHRHEEYATIHGDPPQPSSDQPDVSKP